VDDVNDYAPGDQIPPGAYVAIFTDGPDADVASIRARRLGWVLRDTLLVVEGDKTSFVLLFKRPSDRTIAEDALLGVGVMNVAACRVGRYKNPNAFEGYERTSQVGNWGMRASKSRVGEPSADRRYAESGGTNFALKPGVRGGDLAGRWPPNVLLVEGRLSKGLDQSIRNIYPGFESLQEARAWIEMHLSCPRGRMSPFPDEPTDA